MGLVDENVSINPLAGSLTSDGLRLAKHGCALSLRIVKFQH